MAKTRRRWQPSDKDLQDVFAGLNPWWNTGKVPDELAYTKERPLGRSMWRRLRKDQPRRFHLILGPRRVGKTTAMYQTVRHLLADGVPPSRVWWLRLDHPMLEEFELGKLVEHAIRDAPAADGPTYLFLDEVTYSAKWAAWLKTFYDERWPVRVMATSSSTAALRDGRIESGVGRWEEHYLPPYLFTDFLELTSDCPPLDVRDTLLETLLQAADADPAAFRPLADRRRRFLLCGGFPELLLAGGHPLDDESALLASQRTLRKDAIELAIYKDIPQAFSIDNPQLLERLLHVLAGHAGGVLGPTKICGQLGMSQPTFDKYLSYLEKSFLVFALPNYSHSQLAIQRRGRKLHFVDGAVRNAALERGLRPLSDQAEMGLLSENMAASHLYALSLLTQTQLHFWRDGEREVDLVYDHAAAPLALEVTVASKHTRQGLLALVEREPKLENRSFLCSVDAPMRLRQTELFGDDVGSIPLDLLLVAIGLQAAKSQEKGLA